MLSYCEGQKITELEKIKQVSSYVLFPYFNIYACICYLNYACFLKCMYLFIYLYLHILLYFLFYLCLYIY